MCAGFTCVGQTMLSSTFGAFDLLSHIVDQAVQTGLAERVLTGQQLGLSVAVQADAAGQQLLQLVPGRRHR